jgi:hypothetical protein
MRAALRVLSASSLTKRANSSGFGATECKACAWRKTKMFTATRHTTTSARMLGVFFGMMTMQSPDDLPDPHGWVWNDEPSGKRVYSGWDDPRPTNKSTALYTADQMRAYRAAGVAQERERVRGDLFELYMISELYWKEGGDASHLALNVMNTIRAIRAGHATS